MSGTERPVVGTESGDVQGVSGDGVTALRGIPYAASPVGDRRFAAPQPPPKWTGLREAGRSGPSVPQGPSRLEAVMGARAPDWDEDGCLTLNVWTPPRPGGDPGAGARPVLVWFHGGGFTSGSGGWDWYDGGRLAAAGDVVVVTANYRLGPLGYLYLPEAGIENLGVQDQVAVLDWVERNIGAFGGDPGRLTVGGQSAGAFSALYLALSPDTGPRIGQVIAQSGPWGLPPQDPGEAASHSRRFLDLLGLAGRPDFGAALRAVPAEAFLPAYRQLAQEVSRPGSAAPPMYPVLGGSGIPVAWPQALAAGRLGDKPLLTGTTRDEMAAFFAFDPRIEALAAGQGRSAAEFTRAATEATFRDGTLAIAAHQAEAGHAAYVYQFDRAPVPDPARLGAAHCSELPFLFDTIDAYRDSAMLGLPHPWARRLAGRFSAAVAGFVATGRPADGEWAPYDPARPATVRHLS
jgi:para-nitrobenzyl esterase